MSKILGNGLVESIFKNGVFVLQFLGIVAGFFLVSYIGEKIAKTRRQDKTRILSVRVIAVIAMFSAISAILMLFETPVGFAPNFYEIDASDIPALIGGFAMGPVAGVLIEFIKIVLNLIFNGTDTAFVGELANFVVGCTFIVPATLLYQFKKKRTVAIVACVIGTVVMSLFGTAFNAVYLLPKFSELYGMPLEAIVGMGTKINPAIKDVTTFVFCCVFPLNLLKGTGMSAITLLLYKPVSREFHKFTNM